MVKFIVYDSKQYAQNKVTFRLVITIVDKCTQSIVKEKKNVERKKWIHEVF